MNLNSRKMLEMAKGVLRGVSFDKNLFRKELKKALGWISFEEKAALKHWCKTMFGKTHQDVLLEVF
jgi:hypothetical protein